MRNSVRDLAVGGAAPAFTQPLHVGRPNIGNREQLLARINDLLDRRWLSNAGVYVTEFEQKLAAMLGVKHCIAMCNGTIALEITTRALHMSGEVIVPSMTFIATAHALQWQEVKPVFCDVDPTSCTLDPEQVERLITPNTTGIIGVHLWGRPCKIDALYHIAAKHKLRLVFDAAHSLGVSHAGQMIGGFGDAEVFSFHATKFINSFEGGAVTTNSDELAAQIRLMKNFGFSGYDNVIFPGTNGKMPEASAAMGLTSLESLDEFVDINKTNYAKYSAGLAAIPGVQVLQYPQGEKNNYQYVVAFVDSNRAGLQRDELIEVLHQENVIARRYFYPGCHRMEPYRTTQPNAGENLPVTEQLVQQTLVLPTGTGTSIQAIETITEILHCAVANAKDVKAALSAASASA